jgi:glutamate racemase
MFKGEDKILAIEGQAKTPEEERVALRENRGHGDERSRRKQAMETMNEESVASEHQLASISDPYAHKALQQMIQEERSQLLNLADLIEMVEQGAESGSFTKARQRMSHRLKSPSNKNFAYGVGVALLGALLFPTLKESLHPVAMKAVQGVKDLSEQAKGLLSSVKEDMEDMVAEAEFEKLKNSIDNAVAEEELIDPKDPIQ